MLSTPYRLRLQFICQRIANEAEVPLEDMVWAEKLAKANTSAAQMLKKARLSKNCKDTEEGGLDGFLRDLAIGGTGAGSQGYHYDTVDDIINFWKQDKPDDWRQRD